MSEWQPHREPWRTTLTRTVGIAVVAGSLVALGGGGLRRCGLYVLLFLWPAFGGHWVDLLFLNVIRPRLPRTAAVQRVARIGTWFAGGVVLGVGVRWTARALAGLELAWLTWAAAGLLFIASELAAHASLYRRGRPNFYDGRS